MDLPLYNIDPITGKFSLLMDHMLESTLEVAPTSGPGVLANKVVKYLLTSKGSDTVDPDYGCRLIDFTQISKNQLSRLHMEVLDGISDCTKFIKSTEDKSLPAEDRLKSITLTDLKYGGPLSRDSVHIYLKITTMAGTQALLEFPLNK